MPQDLNIDTQLALFTFLGLAAEDRHCFLLQAELIEPVVQRLILASYKQRGLIATTAAACLYLQLTNGSIIAETQICD